MKYNEYKHTDIFIYLNEFLSMNNCHCDFSPYIK